MSRLCRDFMYSVHPMEARSIQLMIATVKRLMKKWQHCRRAVPWSTSKAESFRLMRHEIMQCQGRATPAGAAAGGRVPPLTSV